MKRKGRSSPVSLFSFQDIVTGMCGIMIFMVLVQVLGLNLAPDVADFTVGPDENADTLALRREIGSLERELADIRVRSRKIAVAPQDAARPGEYEKVTAEFTEKERVLAPLVSQVHDLETQVAAARDADARNKARIKEMERIRLLLEQQVADMKKSKGITLIPQRGSFKIPFYVICSSKGLEILRPLDENAGTVAIAPQEMEARLSEFLGRLDHTTHAAVLLVRPTGIGFADKAVDLLKRNSFTYGRDPLEEWAVVSFGKERR